MEKLLLLDKQLMEHPNSDIFIMSEKISSYLKLSFNVLSIGKFRLHLINFIAIFDFAVFITSIWFSKNAFPGHVLTNNKTYIDFPFPILYYLSKKLERLYR